MDQTNKDLFENIKQYEQDNNNDSPKSVNSDCSSNSLSSREIKQKNKHLKHSVKLLKSIIKKNKVKHNEQIRQYYLNNKDEYKNYYDDNKEYFKNYSKNSI